MKYRRNEGVSVTTVDDGSFIVEPESQDIFYLDVLAGGVWNALEEPMDGDELKALLIEAFPDTPAAQVAADLDALLGEMTGRRLLLTE
jgi:hypothetical protein